MAVKINKQNQLRKRTLQYKKQKIQIYLKGSGKHKILLMQQYPMSGTELDKIPFFTNCTYISIDIPGWIGNSSNIPINYIEIYKIYRYIINKLNIENFNIISFDVLTPIAIKILSDTDKVKKCVLIKPIFQSRKEDKLKIKILNNKVCNYMYSRYLCIKYKHTTSSNLTNHYKEYLNSNQYPNLIKLNNTNILVINPYKDQIEYIRKIIGNENIQTMYTDTINNDTYKTIMKFLE